MRNKILALATSAALLAAGSAKADVASANFTVSATVGKNCLVTASNLNFGNYLGIAEIANVQSAVSVRCTSGTAYTVSLNSGPGSYATRLMGDGSGNSLQYNLYTDEVRSIVFGDNSGTTDNAAGVGTGLADAGEVAYPVYGRLFNSDANKNAPPGAYTATITATVTY